MLLNSKLTHALARPSLLLSTLTFTLFALNGYTEPKSEIELHKLKPMVCHQPPGFHGHMPLMPPYLIGLELSEKQQDQIFEILYAQLPTMRTLEKELQSMHQELMLLRFSKTYDDKKANTLIQKITDIDKKRMTIQVSMDAKIFALLTEQQTNLLKQTMQKMSENPPPLFHPTKAMPSHPNPIKL